MLRPLQMMRLCIDGRMLDPGGTGVATYACALHQAQRIIDPRAEILLDRSSGASKGRWFRRLRALLPLSARGITEIRNPEFGPQGREIFRLAQVWFDIHRRLFPVYVAGEPGIIHWSYPVPLRIVGWKNIYTVHDAIPLLDPKLSPIEPRRHRRLLAAIVGEATRSGALVTVSRSAAHDIVSALACPPEIVFNCYQSVDIHDDPSVRLPAGIEANNYLLVCGSVEPRKNIAAIVAAHRRSAVSLPLVIAGPNGVDAMEFVDRTKVIRLPALERSIMIALLARTRALLMPSLAEGFGRPVAEAQSLGSPVLTSNSGALAEVAGGAAVLVDPHDVVAIGEGIRRIAEDESLRAKLIAKGLANAQRFTPGRFASDLRTAYEGVIARSG